MSSGDLLTANFPAVSPFSGPTSSAILLTFSLTTEIRWTACLENVALDAKEVQQTVSKRAWSTTTTGPGVKMRGWTVLCYSRQRLLTLTAEATTKSQCPKLGSVCVKMTICCREGENCYAHTLLVSVSVCGRWVCWTGRKAVQLRVSIFINFKVFHTPHPFSFNNTVPQLHSVFIFLTLIGHVWWSRYQRETIQSYPNGNSTIKTWL